MRKLKRMVAAAVSAVMLLGGLTGSANAALQAVGPTDPVSTLPAWYQDLNGTALQLCTDQNGFCILTPLFDAAFTFPPNPITTTGPINDTNFLDEGFYFLADSIMNVGPTLTAKAKLRVALEEAFLAGVTPNAGIVFLRLQLAKIPDGLTPNSIFTVTHPYGSFTFESDATGAAISAGPAVFRAEDPLGPAPGIFFPPDMQAAATTHVGPFLRASTGLITDPVTGNIYIGNPATPTTVTGSPNGNNFFRITGPNIGGLGINTVETPLFTLAGRVFTGAIASPMTIDRATYARDATSGQINVFATALPTATLTLSGVGIPATVMTPDVPNTGKFFANIPLATSVLPTSLVISNSLDIPAPIPHPVTLVDEVNISQSIYDPVAKTLRIVADSRDNLAPLPALSVPALLAPNTLDATGTIVHPLATPPANITVHSARGGTASRSVSVFTPAPAPVAVADTATTPAGVPVTISVLTNDTIAAPGIINSGSIVISAPPVATSGFAVPTATGTVVFIPAAGFSGPASFSYTVANTDGTLSNAAAVSVTVTAPAAPPVAVADAATTTTGTAVTIPVLANDTIAAPGVINTGSVVITGAPLNGTAVANVAGTVTFTPAAAFTGTTSFTYTVANTQGAVSNAGTVTVTVGAPVPAPAPVAVADAATTTAGAAVTISVLANDTVAAPGVINTGSVVIATAPLNGTAVANAAGTVTFTPAAGFTGTTSFAYTVANTGGTVSAPATVTVTVNAAAPAPAPVAVANTATTTAGTAVTINVLANDTIAAPGVINTGSVVIASAPLNGTAVANVAGTVTFTPAAGFTGSTSFTYTVANTQGAVSNAATVTVTVNPAAPAETVRATVIEYVGAKGSWNVQGTTTNNTTHTMTVKLTGVVAGLACNADGRVIGTAIATGGRFALAVTGAVGGLLDPRTTNCNSVSVTSSLGAVSPSAAYVLK